MFPRGRMVFPRAEPEGKPSSRGETFHHVTHTGMAYLYNIYRTNPVCNFKQSKVTDDWWFTHSPLGVASGNGQHEALTDGIRQHDDCSLLSQPITAYDLQVRYNNFIYLCYSLSDSSLAITFAAFLWQNVRFFHPNLAHMLGALLNTKSH